AEFAAWGRMKDAVLDALLTPFPPVRPGVRLARRLGSAELLRFARFAVQSTRRYSSELFCGEGARLLVTGNAMHSDLSLDTAGGAILGWLLSMLAQDVGFPVAEGGAQSITDALVRRLEERGGELRCGARVTAVEVRDGTAVGVRTADGEALAAARAVLADVSAPALYRDLVGLEQLPARVAADLTNFAWDDSTVKVDWALSAPVPWTDPAVGRAGTVHLDLDLDAFGRFALVDAGDESVTALGLGLPLGPDQRAAVVDRHVPDAVLAAQVGVVGLLQAGAADLGVEVEVGAAGLAGGVELVLVDRTDVAERVRGQAAVGVLPEGLRLRADPGVVLLPLLDGQHDRRRRVGDHRHRLVRRAVPARAWHALRARRDPLGQLRGGDVQQRPEPLQHGLAAVGLRLQRGPVHAHHQGAAVGHQRPAAIVDDRAARGGQDDLPGVLPVGGLDQLVVVEHLQVVEPRAEGEQQGDHHDADHREPDPGHRARLPSGSPLTALASPGRTVWSPP